MIEKGLKLNLALVTVAPPMGLFAASLDKTMAAYMGFIGTLESSRCISCGDAKNFNFNTEKINLVFGLQVLPNDVSVKLYDDFRAIKGTGICVISLTYEDENAWGGGFLATECGLSKKGEMAIRLMAEKHLILDLAHASHKMAREVLEFVDRENIDIPIMISHTGCHDVYPVSRNLPDDVLRAVARRGGVVGIYNLTFGLHSEYNDAGPWMGHVHHAIQVCGWDHVCIGSDAPYIDYTLEEETASFNQMAKMVDPAKFGARCPMYTINFKGPNRMEKIERVLGANRDEGLMGLNLLNFFQKNLHF